ncbi:MAG: NADH-quinone oxidoreductase subunit NuoK [Armatimonadetes bacterium]|nr:NADH-quinone oxidoreductase subunit NuoK [Armatimonadota bacterium]
MPVPPVPIHAYLVLSGTLFAIGLLGILVRRNAIAVLLGIELMLNAANINFVAFWRYGGGAHIEGLVFALTVITVAAAEAAIALAIILNVYRSFNTVNVDQINLMKG